MEYRDGKIQMACMDTQYSNINAWEDQRLRAGCKFP